MSCGYEKMESRQSPSCGFLLLRFNQDILNNTLAFLTVCIHDKPDIGFLTGPFLSCVLK